MFGCKSFFDLETNIERAQSFFKQNKYQETIDTCKKILATHNISVEALKLIAKSFLATKKIDDARFYFNKALTLKPDDYEVIKDLGNIYQTVGDINGAQKYYRKALNINSYYAPALTNLGILEFNKDNRQEALVFLLKATKSDPKLASAWGNLANAYFQLGQPNEAELSIRKAIALNPNLFNSHFLLATILIEQKKLQEAEQHLRKTIEINPDFSDAYFILANLLNNIQNKDEAIKYKKQYLNLKAKDINTKSNIENVIDLFSKKIISQDNIPTFFDTAIEDHISNQKVNSIDYSFIFESLMKSRDNRFISYKERKKITQNKRQINGLPFYISQGTHSLIKWKEYDLYKTANDMVIYSMLLNEVKPEIIIELGSGSGGSAVWIADICKSLGLNFHIYSYDIKKPNFKYNNITFTEFDIKTLNINEGLPLINCFDNKRILVIEDAHINVLSVLNTVNEFLSSGDYLIVEDSSSKQKQIEEFTRKEPKKFMLDQYYLDFFGTNMTCSIDSIFKVF